MIVRKIIVMKLHLVNIVALKTYYSMTNYTFCLIIHDFNRLDANFQISIDVMSLRNTKKTDKINTEIPSLLWIMNKQVQVLNHCNLFKT